MINNIKFNDQICRFSGNQNQLKVYVYLVNWCNFTIEKHEKNFEHFSSSIADELNIKRERINPILTYLEENEYIRIEEGEAKSKGNFSKRFFILNDVIISTPKLEQSTPKLGSNINPQVGDYKKDNIKKENINNITYNISTFIGGDKNDTHLNKGNENGTRFGSFLYGKETSTYIESTEPERETETLQFEESGNTPNGKEQLLPTDEETTLQREEPNNTLTSTPTKEIKTPDGVILPTRTTTTITSTAICYQDSLNEEKAKVNEIKRDIDSGVFDNLHQLEQRLIFTPIVGGAYGEQLKRYFNYKCGSLCAV